MESPAPFLTLLTPVYIDAVINFRQPFGASPPAFIRGRCRHYDCGGNWAWEDLERGQAGFEVDLERCKLQSPRLRGNE